MACEKKKEYANNVKKFFDDFKTKNIKTMDDLEYLRDIATSFEIKEFSKKTLSQEFPNNKHKSKIGDIVKINPKDMLKKLNKGNARKEDRTAYIGLISETLDNPLFVMDMQNNKKERRYFAPYIDPNDNLVHIMSITVDKGNGNYLQTHFNADIDKLNETMSIGEVVYPVKDGSKNTPNSAQNNRSSPTRSSMPNTRGDTRSITSIGDILSHIKNKVNEFKNSDTKIDMSVNTVWDGIMKSIDIGATPVKHILGAMNKKIDPSKEWFGVTELQKDVSDIINDHRNIKAGIYENAGEIKEYLSTLSKEDSKSLVHALGGDIKPETLNDHLQKLYHTFRDTIDAKAGELVDLGVLDEKNKIDDYLKRYYKQYVDEDHLGSSLAYNKLKKRKDLNLEERIALGMLEDADFVISNTLAEQNIQIEKAKTLKSLADKFGVDGEIEGYIKVSDESVGGGVKKWGALSGKYIPAEVKAEIDHAKFVADQTNILETGLYPIIDHLKVNMTVKNPVTHVYNIASNVLLAGLNGDLQAVGKVLYMRYKTPNKFKALLKTANKYGLNSYLDDFEQAHISLEPDGKTVNPMMSIWKNLYMTQDSKLGAGARKLYDWEDKIFKLSAFKKNLDDGMVEKDAYKQAVDVYVDYSTPLPAGVRFLDKSGLMPFLHYQYKSTPAVAKVMAKHPLRSTLMATGVATLGASAFLNDDEEMLTPLWADDKFNLFGVAEWVRLGNGYYLNAGRMIPGTKFEFELGGIIKGAIDIVNGKTPLGYNISSKYDTDMENYSKRALAMMENFMPSVTLGRYGQRAVHIGLANAGVVKGKKNYYGEDMTVTELATRAVGVRQFNEKKELTSKQKAATNKKKYLNKKNGDKKKNNDEYNKSAQRVKRASKKAGVDLEAKKDSFGFDAGISF